MRQTRLRAASTLSLSALALLASSTRAVAQDDAFTIDKLLAAQTGVVIRIDLNRFDQDAFQKWVTAQTKAARLAKEDEPDIALPVSAVMQVLRNLKAAGAGEMWFFIDLPDLQAGPATAPAARGAGPATSSEPLVFVCVPMGRAVDAAKVEIMFRNNNMTTLRSHGAVIATDDAGKLVFPNRHAIARDDLKSAITTTRPATLGINVGFKSPAIRRLLRQVPPVPVGDTTLSNMLATTDAITWTLDSVKPEGPQFGKLVIKASNEAAAPVLRDGLVAALGMLKEGMPPKALQAFEPLIARAKPTAVGNTVTADLAWGPADFDKLIPPMLHGLVEAHKAALMIASQSNIRQLLFSCKLYTSSHKGQWPPTLADAVKAQQSASEHILVNPRAPDPQAGYVYLKPSGEKAEASDRVVIYELLPAGTNRINVGYADGHCSAVEVEALKQDLEEQKHPPLRTLP